MSAPFLPISFAQLPAYMDLEAAGSSQLDAAQISGSINVYTTVPSGSGAVLPGSYSSGAEIIVFNRGANPLNVYPALDAAIESLGMNQPFPVPAGAVASFFCADPAIAPGRQWYSINWLAGAFATLSVSGNASLTGGVVVQSGATSGRPASPVTGQHYLDTSLGQPVWYITGTGWVNAAGAVV